MTDKILKYMEEYHMLPENGNIVAGVSGGADSVCLLYALVKLRDGSRPGLKLTAVHVNHKLREEAGEDAAFVEELCGRWNVPFLLVEEDVEALAERLHLSCEEAGRTVRYRAFEQALAQMDGGRTTGGGSHRTADGGSHRTVGGGSHRTADGGSHREVGGDAERACESSAREAADGGSAGKRGCIAVAHNRDDRAETLLFHMFRGTGLAGMGSIRPVRENDDGSRIIRPLLFMSRQEIEGFLQKEGIAWRTDHTNAQELYTRNKIRNRILPYAEEQICAQAGEHLAREAALLAETADFVEEMTRKALGRCAVAEEGELRFAVDAFLREVPFLQNQMLHSAIGQTGCQRDLTAAHVAEVKKLFAASCTSGRKVLFPVLQVCARRQFDQVILKRIPEEGGPDFERTRNREAAERGQEENLRIPAVPGTFSVPGLGKVRVRLLAGPAKCAAADGSGAVRGGPDVQTPQKAAENIDFTAFLKNIPEKKYTKWLDYDKILESAVFRTRCAGDYLTIDDALHKKSLKRYMIEEKIPAHEREKLMLLADGAHVIWVPGHRISAAYKVTDRTGTILELCCDPAAPDCGVDEQRYQNTPEEEF